MGDMGDMWKELKKERREMRARLGVTCPQCNVKQPKRILAWRQKNRDAAKKEISRLVARIAVLREE